MSVIRLGLEMNRLWCC